MAKHLNGNGKDVADDLPNLELEYLAGDIRDRFLQLMKAVNQGRAWKDLDEHSQKYLIDGAKQLSRSLIRQIIPLIVGRDWDSVALQIDKLSIDGKHVKLAAIVARKAELVSRLMIYGSQTATLVLCDPEDFYGEREEAEPDPDEPRLPIGAGHQAAYPDDEAQSDM